MNLHAVKNKLLFNTLTAADVGAYLDSVDGTKYLFFKDSRHGTGLAIPFTADTQMVATTGQSAVQGLYVLNVNQYARLCQDCDHEWVLTSREEERVPGRNNSERTPKFIPYSMNIPAPQITTGVYSTTDQAAVRSELVNLIAAHTGKYGSPFYASKAWKFTFTTGSNVQLANSGLSFDTGVIATATYNTDALMQARIVALINASSVLRAVADPSNALVVYVMATGAQNGLLTTTWSTKTNITETTDATGVYFIGLSAKSTDTAAYVEVRSDEMLSITAKQTPQFATLTSNDVFEQFMLDPNDGNLAQFRRQLIPNDVAFTRYYFKWKQPKGVPSTSEGASFFNELWREAYVYMPTSVASDATNKWDATNLMYESGDSVFQVDASWADLLTWWQNDAAVGAITDPVKSASIVLATAANANGVITISVNNGAYIWTFNVADTTAVDVTGAALAAAIDATPGFTSTTYFAGADALLISGTVDIDACTFTSTCGTTGAVTIV